MAVDNPLDQVAAQYPEEQENYGPTVVLKLFSLLPNGQIAGLVDAIRGHFSTRRSIERLSAFVETLIAEVQRHGKKIEELENQAASDPDFSEAMVFAATQAILTTSAVKVQRYGLIVATELITEHPQGWDEVSSLISDVGRLSEADISVLRVIVEIQREHVLQIAQNPSDYLYDALANTVGTVLQKADRSGRSRNEFYSHLYRLAGFGLAMPLNWKTTAWGPSDQGFAATLRGVYLVDALDKRSPVDKS